MRVLFLTPRLPYPPVGGGLVKSWALVEFLRQQAEVWILCFQGAPWSAQQEAWVASWGGRLRAFPLRRERDAISFLASLIHRLPLSVYRHWCPAMAEGVAKTLEEGIDVVFADHLYMAQFVPSDFSGPRVLHLHNVESLLWERYAPFAGPLRPLVWWEALRLRQYEKKVFSMFHRLLVVSEEERAAVMGMGVPAWQVLLVPNVPRPDLLARPPLEPPPSKTVAFLGTLSWPPNQVSLRWFMRACWPHLRRRVPQAHLVIGGGEPPLWLQRWVQARTDIDLRCPLDDAAEEEIYQGARALVEPALTGGGSKVKVLNALARGLPVVTTPRGVQGLRAVPGAHLLVASTPQEMVQAIASLMDQDGLWRRLSRGGRELVGQFYTLEEAFSHLGEVLS